MPGYTFKVTVKATDRIFSLKFSPEGNDDLSIIWNRQEGFSKFTSDPFSVEVTGQFDYKIVLGARTTTKYDYLIQIKSGGKWVDIKKDTRTVSNKNSDTVTESIDIDPSIKPLPAI